ncbi:hypothetical protein G5I_04984 [Acromyrmex echinatior]|uniref:Uncharacterized protein n=1 Tax=Acromyrmex echinatior TaxID=103372 RepID=F4WH31_ACREC|nr:hypothetical protein G5I_04984 [Acromyrmex echinatior]
MNAEQRLSPIRKKTKSIVSSPSPLFYAKSRLKLTQKYALTASSSGTQVVLYLERFQETGRRDEPREESELIDRFLPLRAELLADRSISPKTLTAVPKQTLDATNRLRFVHFQLNRRTRIVYAFFIVKNSQRTNPNNGCFQTIIVDNLNREPAVDGLFSNVLIPWRSPGSRKGKRKWPAATCDSCRKTAGLVDSEKDKDEKSETERVQRLFPTM